MCRNATGSSFGLASFSVGANDSVVCTITNTRSTGSVTVNKVWVGGATGEAPTVNLNVVGLSPSTTQVTGLGNGTTGAKPVVTGTYSATETGLVAGWTQTGASCVKNATGSSFDPTNFSVGASDSVVCTFTNTRSAGSVTVIKHWVGGATGETPGVDLNISGPSSSTTHVAGLADGSTGAKPVVTGTYSASESGLAAGWTQTAGSCVRNATGSSFGPTSFSVGANDSVVCTITNTRSAGSVTVNKVWVGGAPGEAPTVNLNVVVCRPARRRSLVWGTARRVRSRS